MIATENRSRCFVSGIEAPTKTCSTKRRSLFIDLLSAHDDVEAGLVREYVGARAFVLTTRFAKDDMTDEGYDFNGWILEFYQEQCNGIVQIDNQGFYSPKARSPSISPSKRNEPPWQVQLCPTLLRCIQKLTTGFQRANAALLGEVSCRLGAGLGRVGPATAAHSSLKERSTVISPLGE